MSNSGTAKSSEQSSASRYSVTNATIPHSTQIYRLKTSRSKLYSIPHSPANLAAALASVCLLGSHVGYAQSFEVGSSVSAEISSELSTAISAPTSESAWMVSNAMDRPWSLEASFSSPSSDSTFDLLPMNYRYVPPPPRHAHPYRPYRPQWQFHIVPPPILTPGWFGLYFLGNPPPPPPEPRPEPMKKPDFRHVNDYSFSMTIGGHSVQYAGDGDIYTDPGVKVALQYRNSPVVGAELSVGLFGTGLRPDGAEVLPSRLDVPLQASAMVHIFPRSPIQPFLAMGGTVDFRTYQYVEVASGDACGGSTTCYEFGDLYTEARFGPHLGIGLELLIGDRVGATVEARHIFYTLVDRRVVDQTTQENVLVTGGLNLYF